MIAIMIGPPAKMCRQTHRPSVNGAERFLFEDGQRQQPLQLCGVALGSSPFQPTAFFDAVAGAPRTITRAGGSAQAA